MFFLHRKQGFLIVGCISCVISSCMEEVNVDAMYGTQLDLNGGDCTPHTLQRIYFSNINENKMSDRETPV